MAFLYPNYFNFHFFKIQFNCYLYLHQFYYLFKTFYIKKKEILNNFIKF
jgi:hypothetical protein